MNTLTLGIRVLIKASSRVPSHRHLETIFLLFTVTIRTTDEPRSFDQIMTIRQYSATLGYVCDASVVMRATGGHGLIHSSEIV